MGRSSYFSSVKLLLLIIMGCFTTWPSATAQPKTNDFDENCEQITDATNARQVPNMSLSDNSDWCFILEMDSNVFIFAQSPHFDIWVEVYSEAPCESNENIGYYFDNEPCLMDADDDSYLLTDAFVNTTLKSGKYLVRVGSHEAIKSTVEPAQTDQYQLLMSSIAIEEGDQGNCVVNTIGQDWHPSGGGGFELEDDSEEILRKTVEIPFWVSNEFESSDIDETLKVVLLVIDDFSSKSVYEMLNDPLTNQKETPSHGDVVMHHLQKIDAEYSAYFGTPSATFHDMSNSIDLQPGINVVQLSLGSYDELDKSRTELVAARLRSMVASLLENGAQRIVVNLSFSFIPCKVLEGLEARRLLTNQQDMSNSLCENYETPVNHSLVKEILTQSDTGVSDILGKSFKHLPDTKDKNEQDLDYMLFVAAAGNIGILPHPLYPGAWNEVISVTATDKSGDLAPYASFGEVSLPGGCFRYGNTNYLYAGTSFAAPLLSYISALHFLMPEPSCPFNVLPPPIDSPLVKPSNVAPSLLEVLENCG